MVEILNKKLHFLHPAQLTRIIKVISKEVCKIAILPGLMIFLLIFPCRSMAQGNLLVTPRRVVFEGSKRSEELNLANVGNDTATYFISIIQIRMKEDGAFEKITQPDSGQKFADKNIRFFPRSVTLAPNEAQSVKMQITKSNELQDGEYRSHIYFRALPKEKPLGEKKPFKDSGVSVQLIPIFGISIPVIIRRGENTTNLSLSDLVFSYDKDTIPALTLTINRIGNMSVYGDLWVEHTSVEGKVTRAGIINGLAVYFPLTLRHVRFPLDKDAGINYHTGTLHIVYSDQSSRKIAQRELYLH